MSYQKKGFSLMELMIVVAIVGILTAIAFPSYQNYLRKSRRTEGQAALLNLATSMERFFTENNTYVGGPGGGQVLPYNSEHNYYQINANNITAAAYTLTATAIGDQGNDTAYDSVNNLSANCGTLSINQLGQKTPLACWSTN